MTDPDFSELPLSMRDLVVDVARLVIDRKRFALVGPPSPTKTMIARRTVGLLSLTTTKQIELFAVYRAARMTSRHDVHLSAASFDRPPFRAPHHTVSAAALTGQLGEAEFARYGVLFLDEVAEFQLSAIQSLKYKLDEMGTGSPVVITSTATCPCGWRGQSLRECACGEASVIRWQSRLTSINRTLGIVDVVQVPVVMLNEMADAPRGPSTREIESIVRGL